MSNAIIIAGEYRKLQSMVLATGQTPKPGQLVLETSAGELSVHATAGGVAERIVLLEDALQGKTKDDAYAAGDVADAAIVEPGTETQVLLAAGASVTRGGFLKSNGAGKFIAHGGTGAALCVVRETKDLSASGAVDTLVAARWL